VTTVPMFSLITLPFRETAIGLYKKAIPWNLRSYRVRRGRKPLT
jgi:hypothetical protein